MNRISRRRLALIAAALSAAFATAPAWADHDAAASASGRVFTSSNAPAGNALLVFARSHAGALTLVQQVATQGLGTGAGLGSQGAVTLSGDGRHLFVVNAQSHTVSTFEVGQAGATLRSVTDSGGLMPISVTEHDGLVYVLNAGGTGQVAGFRLHHDQLVPLSDGTRGLSAAGGTGPAQVGFSSDGDSLVVTEKATNLVLSWPVRRDGSLGPRTNTPSAGLTPFGFAFDNRDTLIVSEAVGGAALASTTSSYRFDERSPALPRLVSAAVPTMQTAACWVAVTPNGRFAYTGNAGSDSVSSYRVRHDGSLTLGDAAAGSTGAGNGATDLAIPRNGRTLFALAPRGHRIVGYGIGADGRLTTQGAAEGLPATAVGLAAD